MLRRVYENPIFFHAGGAPTLESRFFTCCASSAHENKNPKKNKKSHPPPPDPPPPNLCGGRPPPPNPGWVQPSALARHRVPLAALDSRHPIPDALLHGRHRRQIRADPSGRCPPSPLTAFAMRGAHCHAPVGHYCRHWPGRERVWERERERSSRRGDKDEVGREVMS